MAISKETLIQLGRDVDAAIASVGARYGASTKEVFGWLAKANLEVPGKDDQARYRMLGILAEHGYPGATQGDARQVKRYGKQVTMRPWVWRRPDKEALEAWASGAGPTPRVNVSAEIRALVSRVEQLEARVAELEGKKSVADLTQAVAQ